ncbi:hypothetical protein JXI42_11120 [bacterium]|nr:hypothetical protein [bacterium]
MVNIKLGDTLIAFSSQDNTFLEKASADYQEFLVTGDPDFYTDFTLDSNLSPAKVKKIIRYAHSHIDGNRYYTELELIDCKLNWEIHYLSVHTQKAIFQDQVDYRLMNYLMRGIYAGVIKKSRKMPIDKHIVHGCGVAQDDKYFLFTGGSGSGKTTVAKLGGSRIVLNDEAVLMNCRDSIINISGSPLDSELPLKSKKEGPLTAIFSSACIGGKVGETKSLPSLCNVSLSGI